MPKLSMRIELIDSALVCILDLRCEMAIGKELDMKTLLLALSAASVIASAGAYAETNLCDTNLQQLDDSMSSKAVIGEPMKGELDGYISDAKKAKSSGDTEACITASTKALQLLKAPGGSGSSNGAAGS